MKRMSVSSCPGPWRAAVLGAGMILAAGTGPVFACGANPYVGEICVFATNFCPVGYASAAGQRVASSYNLLLFKLIGILYGGSEESFNLPNLQATMMIGSDDPAVVGQTIGGQTADLGVLNLPPHSHDLSPTTVTVSGGSVTVPFNAIPASGATPSVAPGAVIYPTNARGGSGASTLRGAFTTTAPSPNLLNVALMPVVASGTVAIAGTTSAVGGSMPLPIQSPALALSVCIALDGTYPNLPGTAQ